MDKNNLTNPTSNSIKNLNDKPKIISPAILGMSSSHGLKLSVNMTSKDKQELLSKVEEWRKARWEKLSANILSKQKQGEKPKVPATLPIKSRNGVSSQEKDNNVQKVQDRSLFFEGLHKNTGRVSTFKKQEVKENSKPPQNNGKIFKKPSPLSVGKPSRPQVSQVQKKIVEKPLVLSDELSSKSVKVASVENISISENPKPQESEVMAMKVEDSKMQTVESVTEIREQTIEECKNEIKPDGKVEQNQEAVTEDTGKVHIEEAKPEVKEGEIQDEETKIEESKIQEIEIVKETSEKNTEEFENAIKSSISEGLINEDTKAENQITSEIEKREQEAKIEEREVQHQEMEVMKSKTPDGTEPDHLKTIQKVVEWVPEAEKDSDKNLVASEAKTCVGIKNTKETNEVCNEIKKISNKMSTVEESSVQKYVQPKPIIPKKSVNNLQKTQIKNDSSSGGLKKDQPPKKPVMRNSCFPNLMIPKGLPSVPSIKKSKAPSSKHQPLRRSISMLYRNKCRNSESAIHRTVSEKDLQNLKEESGDKATVLPSKVNVGEKCQPSGKSVSFLTPKHNHMLTPFHLRSKLEEWLKVNGHPLDGYRHLRCFDVESNSKPLLRTPKISQNSMNFSMETPLYSTAPTTPVDDSDKENMTPPTVIQQIKESDVENWLKELHQLIVKLKYPSERCEEWLNAIRKRCATCAHLPVYWECLAALDESRGEVKSAIENYERAIIKGAEVDSVGDSLAQLFDKMVLEQKKPSKAKLEKGLDPKNIFKSTIIKFALQQKAVKELGSKIDQNTKQQLYVATPVRRSSRIQTPYSSRVVNSLQSLTPEVRNNVTFKPNESLLTGD